MKYLVLLIAMAYNVMAYNATTKADIDKQIESIYKKYKVKVMFDSSDRKYSPNNLPKRASVFTIESEPMVQNAILKDIVKFLDTHPAKVVNKNLKQISNFRKMKIGQALYGGTYYKDVIYVRQGSLSLLHHEFSSLILKNYRFSDSKWKRANVKRYRYPYKNGAKALQEKANNTAKNMNLSKDELRNMGFLTWYSSTALEEDVNIYSDWLFSKQDELLELCGKYPRIANKVKLLIGYYIKVDKGYKVPLSDIKSRLTQL